MGMVSQHFRLRLRPLASVVSATRLPAAATTSPARHWDQTFNRSGPAILIEVHELDAGVLEHLSDAVELVG